MTPRTRSAKIGFPKTAFEFIAATPAGKLERGEFTLQVGDDESLAIAIAAANGHAAYAWWKAYGDAFHLNPYEIENIAVPSAWVADEATRRRVVSLGRRLIGAVTPKNIVVITTGTKKTRHESLNFHACEPETIAEIDELYLSSLGLPREPLLPQLRELRVCLINDGKDGILPA